MNRLYETLAPAVGQWSAANPEAVGAMTVLYERGVRAGLFASTVALIAAISAGATCPRPPDDIDLLLPSADFDLAAEELGAQVILNKKVTIHTGDGLALRFRADEAVSKWETGVIVHAMRPLTPVMAKGGSHRYSTVVTDTAAANFLTFPTDEGIVTLAHPWETIALNGTMQRSKRKNDRHNTMLLGNLCPGSLYAKKRTDEMGLDKRALHFIQAAT